MKHIFTGFNLIGAFALLALAVGCSSTQTQHKENLLFAAGFKVVTPTLPRSNKSSKPFHQTT